MTCFPALINCGPLTPETFGAKGDGVTSDYAALTALAAAAAAVAAANGSCDVYLSHAYNIGANILDLSACSNTRWYGPGAIVGASVDMPAGIKVWGSLGTTAAPYGSTIPAGTSSFAVNNQFSANQLLLLSNYPTDPGGSDNYTLLPADIFGRQARSYQYATLSNLRQTRRKDLLLVETATGTGLTTFDNTTDAYNSTEALLFQQVLPVANFNFYATLRNVWFSAQYCQNIRLGGSWFAAHAEMVSCYGVTADYTIFDAQNTPARFNPYEATRFVQLRGLFRGTTTPSDNGIISTCGVVDLRIDVVVEGSRGGYGHGVQIDTDYGESWTGYTDLPTANFSVNVIARNLQGHAVFVTCNRFFTSANNGYVNVVGNIGADSLDPIHLAGASNVIVDLQAHPDPGSSGNSVDLQGAWHIVLRGRIGNVYLANQANPLGGTGQYYCFDIQGVPITWAPTDGSGAGLVFSDVAASAICSNRNVNYWARLTYPVTTDATNAQVDGLPWVAGSAIYATGIGPLFIPGLGIAGNALVIPATGAMELKNAGTGASFTNSQLSGQTIYFSGSYPIDLQPDPPPP